MKNLHREEAIRVRDVTRDPAARAALDRLASPSAKVPALGQGDKVQQESGAIVETLAELYARCAV